MSKSISFGFGKSKPTAQAQKFTASTSKHVAPARPAKAALHQDSDDEDEDEPRHESVTGFSSSGAILSQPLQEPQERIIENPGNSDWRKRGRKNLLPAEVQAQQQDGQVVMVERNEVSSASGLQFAEKGAEPDLSADLEEPSPSAPPTQERSLTADEEALRALLDDGSGKPKSTAVITQQGNIRLTARNEVEEFKDDVASRPESSTLEEYAAMPVEEFGMAMLRGMGKKRRANGEVIDLNPKTDSGPMARKQEGFLGIGAKPVPGSDIELGAWGKADMRRNNRGEGFFTPLMRENKATGERITEDELQQKIKGTRGEKQDDDWRKRRDRNLEHNQRDSDRDRDKNRDRDRRNGNNDYRDDMNSSSRSSRRDWDEREYDSSRSGRDRSRSKGRRRCDDDHKSRHSDRHRDRYRDEDRYDSSSSRRSHRDYDGGSERRNR